VNRALRAVTIGALLLSPVVLSSCSAGQVNQTSSQSRDKSGGVAQSGNITLREAELAYPATGTYAKGSDAVLTMAIVNSGNSADTLVSISGNDFTGIRVTGTGANAAAPSGTASPTGTAAATTTAAGTTAATTTAAGSRATTTAATATTTAALPTEAISTAAAIAVPANSAIFLGKNAPHVTLVGLTHAITPAQSLRVTFTFQKAGAIPVDVIVAQPTSPEPRTSTFNFEEPTQGNEPNTEAGGGGIPSQSNGGNG
jgi:copper(I)-binding protein